MQHKQLTEPTNKHQIIYDFILGYIKSHLYSPTYREILEGVPQIKSLSTLYNYIYDLRDLGLITISETGSRIGLVGYKLIKTQ